MRLEPYAVKTACSVPRGEGGRKAILLPDYMREEFALDALNDYSVEPDDATRLVPNPAWAAIDVKYSHAQAELERLQSQYGLEAFMNLETQRRTMRGFKIAQGHLGKRIVSAFNRLIHLADQRTKVPRRVPIQEVRAEPVIKLAPERKHLTNILKMVAYQAESELYRAIADHYARFEDEGRTLIQSALAGAADLEVTSKELRVTLMPLSSAHRSRAIAALCEELNKLNTVFPGSKLRLIFGVRATI